MQCEEESPKQYVDIARAPDEAMRPERSLCDRGRSLPILARNGKTVAQRPVPFGVAVRTGVCFVERLDHIDIWPATLASQPSRPDRNAARAYI